MGKRFTATEKWGKEWFQTLKPKHKCLMLYLYDNCSHAGIWELNYSLASLQVGEKIEEQDFEILGDNVLRISDDKYFVVGFVDFQYGTLKDNNKAHTKSIERLRKYDLIEEVSEGAYKEHVSHLQGHKVKVMVKEEVTAKEEAVEMVTTNETQIVLPYDSEAFVRIWRLLISQKKWKKKSRAALQISLKRLSEHPEHDAILMMENAIAGDWQGLVEIKTNNYGKTNSTSAKDTGFDPEKVRGLFKSLKESESTDGNKLLQAPGNTDAQPGH